ncbi:fungal-specific transcription factor domain-containing protein [Talaromyces proteolyticus]|uniref:Fungal-specific transcription factor domain-containing protein n=1 Tax=Talaromyces proteolyticus TaxID=1131652 RepID=A0AAD4KUT2_9EURO|nr:fungal-specific transcription factor domain-containing protein [Talaromyces proteolyticus]KAH8700390.1 fungal-specific transcription factor domain-containing protein [Talaromyces proteolyticus]
MTFFVDQKPYEYISRIPRRSNYLLKAVIIMEPAWEIHKDLIRKLFLEEGKTLHEVMDYIEEIHNFSSSKAMYERQLKKWGFHKNLKGNDWKIIQYKIEKRKRDGKRTDVYIRNTLVPEKKVKKEISRHAATIWETFYARNAPSPKTPEGMSINTPGQVSQSEETETESFPGFNINAFRRSWLPLLPKELPIYIEGIETEIDRRFLDHFVFEFSRVLTLINDDSNPFKEILLPMATQHGCLMHSLMCLSGSHLSARDPEPRFKERKHYHFDRAITDLRQSIEAEPPANTRLLVEDPIIASTLALCLNTICEGETEGEYRSHMDAARYLLTTQKPRSEVFRQFIVEFYQYHDVSNSITSLDRRPLSLRIHLFNPHAQTGTFLGIFDGLFYHISEVTRLRDRIRHRRSFEREPAVDYQILNEAVAIDSALRAWEPTYTIETPNWYASQLYRQSTWVYLYRTIHSSRPSEKISQVVDDALKYLDMLPSNAGAYSIILMPLFLISCSAFEPRQRERIKKGFDALKEYSSLRNIDPVLKVVQRVWEVMDTKIEDSWDWEHIIAEMDMDFLIH